MNKSNIFNPGVFNGITIEPSNEPMKKGKAKGWLGEYHWVSLPITESGNKTVEALNWSADNFGKSGHRWFEKEGKFYFKDEKDMTVFILRWS